jgi:hypothetical protein
MPWVHVDTLDPAYQSGASDATPVSMTARIRHGSLAGQRAFFHSVDGGDTWTATVLPSGDPGDEESCGPAHLATTHDNAGGEHLYAFTCKPAGFALTPVLYRLTPGPNPALELECPIHAYAGLCNKGNNLSFNSGLVNTGGDSVAFMFPVVDHGDTDMVVGQMAFGPSASSCPQPEPAPPKL